MSTAKSGPHLDILIVDCQGGLRGKRLPGTHLDKVLSGQTRMPLSTQAMDVWGDDVDHITQLGLSQGDPDGFCIPQLGGLHNQPWNGDSSQVLCSLQTEKGEPSDFDVRAILQRQVDLLSAQGLTAVTAIELEFYLFDGETRSSGQPAIPQCLSVARKPNELQLYDMRAMDRVSDVLDCVHAYAASMRIPAETSLSEFGPGQFEVNLKHQSDPVKAADHAVLFKQLVDRAAHRHGLLASFMAKPYTEHSGSGQHVHLSLLNKQGENVFDASDDSQATHLLQAVAACLNRMEESQLLLAPHANSYRRLQPESFAPVRQDWGYDHRGVALRLPETTGTAARIEHRVAGADANPYLLLSVLMASVREGLEMKALPALPALMPGEEPTAKLLTHDWLTAVDRFEQSTWIREVLGDSFATIYTRIKRHEALRFNRQVSDIDLHTYLSRI